MAEIEKNAMFKLSYGLFVLSSVEFGKDNGCIINTVMQITDDPKRIAVGVNKSNRTHEMIEATGTFNVSVLTESTPFEVFERFGFQSGRDADKFAGIPMVRTENWVRYLPEHTNAVLSGEVIQKIDCGTHTLFVADVTEAKVLSDEPLFFLLNSYTTGLSPLAMSYIIQLRLCRRFGGNTEAGELALPVTATGGFLPCGASVRWSNVNK